MKTKNKLLLVALSTLAALPVCAEEVASSPVKANVTLANEYLLRGISQTVGKPAVQGGFDFMHTSGFYAGIWGSNVSVQSDKVAAANSSMEVNTYAGIRNSLDTDLSYDLGYLRYAFPGVYKGSVSPDTREVYGALIYQALAVKYSYSLGNTFGLLNARGSNYLDISLEMPVSDTGFNLGLHYGKQRYKGWDALAKKVAGQDPDYADYRVSVSYNLSGYVLKAAYSKTNTKKGVGNYYNMLGEDLGKAATVVSLNRTF